MITHVRVMGQIIDNLLSTLGLNFDNSENDLDSYGSTLDIDELGRRKYGVKRNYNDCVLCEQQIIKCRKEHGRVLGIDSKALRQRFGDKCVDLALYRTSQRKYRGNCDVKRLEENQEKQIKKIGEVIQAFMPKDNFQNKSL